jgi:hypothetical protein
LLNKFSAPPALEKISFPVTIYVTVADANDDKADLDIIDYVFDVLSAPSRAKTRT